MATVVTRSNTFYGYPNPQGTQFPDPIIANRAPTQADKAIIGQLWVYPATNSSYILSSINTSGQSVWTVLNIGGAGVFSSLQVNGPSTFAGNIVQQAPGVTATFLATTTAGLTNNGVFTNNGNAGINGQLNITENVADAVIVTSSNRGGGSRHLLCFQSSVDANAVQFTTVKSRAGAVVNTADSLFQQNIIAQGVTGLTTSGRIEFTAGTPVPASTQVPSSLAILTTDTAGVLANRFNISTNGAVNLPTQPCFVLILDDNGGAGAYNNVTGNANIWDIGNPAFAGVGGPSQYNVILNNGAGVINANGQYVIPITGRYLFNCQVRLSNVGTATGCQLRLIKNASFIGAVENNCNVSSSGFLTLSTSSIVECTAGDVIYQQIQVVGMAGDTASVNSDGAAYLSTYLTGALLN